MRIFDTFLFDGELALLRHRLEETHDLVDCFVLVEARRTYRDRPKSLVFAEHKEQFAWAAKKIRAIALDSLGAAGLAPRMRAQVQRNAIMLGLRDAQADDVVLILDADEIPSREFLLNTRARGLAVPVRLAMTRHYEYLNTLAPASPCCPRADTLFPTAPVHRAAISWERLDDIWHGRSGVAVRFQDLQQTSPFNLRFGSSIVAGADNAGRHLTCVDPSARLERKLERVFHEEYADTRGLSPEHLLRSRRYGLHHRGWWYAKIPQGPLPGDLQRLAVRHPEMIRMQSMPRMFMRRALRSWAWLRLRPALPSRCVFYIDRHFSMLLPMLLLPLLLADCMRAAMASAYRRREAANESSPAQHHTVHSP